MQAPAPALAPPSIEAAFAELRARMPAAAEDPISVLNRAASPREKLAEIAAFLAAPDPKLLP